MDHKRICVEWMFYRHSVHTKKTDGSVIAGSSAERAVKSISWRMCRVMEVTCVEQCSYFKIAVLRRKNAMEYLSELEQAHGNNALPYRTVAWWVYFILCCHSFAL
ncbi:hypothetical protein TNCV_3868671 [Trichonephila clavipes]|nr:hypothetical protein TNCV_3868671 [Trichonephila clavipes]